jgi:UDP-N-acetyl-D-glucosamine/UDP-N-acetyl-D-galactosamine dehydrogenase
MIKICIIGLGYVGLPILINLSKKFDCIGYDVNTKRINDLSNGKDIFNEFKAKTLLNKKIKFIKLKKNLKNYNLFIVAVPTPIYSDKKPDLRNLKNVCKNLSKILKVNDVVIFESTVYPGVTDEFCIPILEKKSKLTEGKNFFVGYSPERVNPGDNKHDLKKINKILAYPHEYFKTHLIKIYSLISKKIIFTKNIREAETAKVIENIQRDVNIGLINEIYLVCENLKIDFNNVIKLASTKWNFLRFKPGLVGGHCLPVDPYYLSYISKKNKFNTKITLAGRIINDSMEGAICKKIKRELEFIDPNENKKILICGLSYKKDVADLRNSLSLKIFNSLKCKNIKGYDPLLESSIAKKNGLVTSKKEFLNFDIYVILMKHSILKKQIKKLKNKIIINTI